MYYMTGFQFDRYRVIWISNTVDFLCFQLFVAEQTMQRKIERKNNRKQPVNRTVPIWIWSGGFESNLWVSAFREEKKNWKTQIHKNTHQLCVLWYVGHILNCFENSRNAHVTIRGACVVWLNMQSFACSLFIFFSLAVLSRLVYSLF